MIGSIHQLSKKLENPLNRFSLLLQLIADNTAVKKPFELFEFVRLQQEKETHLEENRQKLLEKSNLEGPDGKTKLKLVDTTPSNKSRKRTRSEEENSSWKQGRHECCVYVCNCLGVFDFGKETDETIIRALFSVFGKL